MKLIPLHKLFDVKYGNSLELINLEQCSKSNPNAINFVFRTEKNNGISAFVLKNEEISENPANTISVAVGGSVLASFLQPNPYYTGFHVLVLSPKNPMTEAELLYYCICIKSNKYKYNYGRQANKTLKEIMIPAEIPFEFQKININSVVVPVKSPINTNSLLLNTGLWEWHEIKNLFKIKKGKRLTKEDMTKGNTPFIGSIATNNGYREYIGQTHNHKGNTITVNYNGSVAEAFYQPQPFWASDDVNVLYPKFEMNPFHALFIATIIKAEKYRFNYGRKWHVERMNKTKIKLPTTSTKQPDFDFMESYIKSLPYSSSI
jgi:hypothetical protein